MIRSRAPNLDDDAIAVIVGILDGWTGKLSWEALIDAIERRTRVRYTRQALHRHARIRSAFSFRKKALAGARQKVGPVADSPELAAALQRIERLQGENARLTAENHNLLEQFARWAYNAHSRGLDQNFLNRPLPPVDRRESGRRQSQQSKPEQE
jgi:hypothetical protein